MPGQLRYKDLHGPPLITFLNTRLRIARRLGLVTDELMRLILGIGMTAYSAESNFAYWRYAAGVANVSPVRSRHA